MRKECYQVVEMYVVHGERWSCINYSTFRIKSKQKNVQGKLLPSIMDFYFVSQNFSEVGDFCNPVFQIYDVLSIFFVGRGYIHGHSCYRGYFLGQSITLEMISNIVFTSPICYCVFQTTYLLNFIPSNLQKHFLYLIPMLDAFYICIIHS